MQILNSNRFDQSWVPRCHISPLTKEQGDPLIQRHYLAKWPGVRHLVLGMWLDHCLLLGIIVYASPPRETSKRYGGVTWELARLWISDSVPRNAESWFISQSVKYVRHHHRNVEYLVSYADSVQGHVGTIYKASNWLQDGWTDMERASPRCDYMVESTGVRYSRRSHVPSHQQMEIIRVPRSKKYRFYLPLKK